MTIDAATRRALEITMYVYLFICIYVCIYMYVYSPQHANSKKSTLLGCIDMTITSAGSRLIRRMISSVSLSLLCK